MVHQLKITKYRKFHDIVIEFTQHINAISGTNGTCKTSLLHIISNSFQAVTSKCDWVKDINCLKVLKTLNNSVNPKVETLTRGDKYYNDPAIGQKGTLFSVQYFTKELTLAFRRHNSSVDSRYSVKPSYKKGEHEQLPFCPVVYLGLSRLIPYGEIKEETRIIKQENLLPEKYKNELMTLYEDFTTYQIQLDKVQKIGDEKIRSEFSTNKDGIDSNTISAGEDNLYIIISALITLKYYYESIDSRNKVESILLIDEFDASLHPAFQIKLLKLFRKFSEEYKIQIIFTTHSMSTIDDLYKNKDNIIYLIDNMTNTIKLDNPSPYRIQMYLNTLTQEELFANKKIPIFSEDNETRDLINLIFGYLSENYIDFKTITKYFYFVDVNIGADSLIGIFKKMNELHLLNSICILDGDHNKDLNYCIMTLPGTNKKNNKYNLSPEKLLFDYAEQLYLDDSLFWQETNIIDKGYSKLFYINRIKKPIKEFLKEKEEKTTSLKEREFNKSLYQNYKDFFLLVFNHWLHDESNLDSIKKFYTDLHVLFLKTSIFCGIAPDIWKF